MSYSIKHHRRPLPWHEFKKIALHPFVLPFYFLNWFGEWAAYLLGKWSLFDVLEYLERLSILFAVIFYFAGAGDRLKQKHYQAWQVINTAQGKGGSGGRIEALRELNEDHVPLVGVDVSTSYLQNVQLIQADLRRSDFRAADLRGAIFVKSDLEGAQLHSANLRKADLTHTNLADVRLMDADLNGACLINADLRGVNLDRADLRGADLSGATAWNAIESVRLANIHGVRSAPEGFVAWAIAHGAVDAATDDAWGRLLAADPSTRPAPAP